MSPTFNPDLQSQTSYPSGPSLKNPPRKSIVAGFVLDNAACIAWGSRILEEPLSTEVRRDSMAAFCVIMEKIESKPYNAYFTMFGPESYKQYMVVTQSKPFRGWKGMDPKLIPVLEEGERELAARELLKAEGGLPSDAYILLVGLTSASQVSHNLNSEQYCISPSKFWKAVLNAKELLPARSPKNGEGV